MRANDVLPDHVNEAQFKGLTVRKGSVAAFLANATAWQDPSVTGAARAAVLADIEAGLPALHAVGLFDVLEIRDPALRAVVQGLAAPVPPASPEALAPTATATATATALPDLDALYAPPSETVQRAVLDRLIDVHEAYLKAATFFCLATGSAQGLDASPRGGPPGFVQVLDAHTLAFADWPGNNRIESLRNLVRDDRIGLLFLFPGQELFLRINGRGRVSTDAGLRAQLNEGGRIPKTATVVLIEEVIVHCGKALHRARLWSEAASAPAHGALPTVGEMMRAFAKLDTAPAEIDDAQVVQINAHYAQAMRGDLY